MNKVVVAVTAGHAIPLSVRLAHEQATRRVLPPGFELEYVEDDTHWRALATVLEREANSPFPRWILFQDVDCLAPTSAYEQLWDDLAYGADMAGIAQAANHIDANRVYAGPAFCLIHPSTWRLCGCPSPRPNETHDVFQRVSDEWSDDPVLYWPVEHSRFGPVWKCGPKHNFGYDTVYDNGVYHAFCIRDGAEREASFLARCANWGC